MEELLRASVPPDEELVDLIESAFLAGQIDGLKADLAYLWLRIAEQDELRPDGRHFCQLCQ